MNALLNAPRSALVLGVAGLIPFALSTYVFITAAGQTDPGAGLRGSIAIASVVIYGAVILSFLGGTRWGVEIAARHARGDGAPDTLTLTLSILSSVVGWVAAILALPPVAAPVYGLVMMMGAYAALLLWDLTAVRDGLWPEWYGPLRSVLTTGAIIALGLTLWRWMALIEGARASAPA